MVHVMSTVKVILMFRNNVLEHTLFGHMGNSLPGACSQKINKNTLIND